MSRSAEQSLEFDRLKEILAGYSTCASGHRAIEALRPGQDVHALGREFALISEAVAYLRPGAELGFGSLADPDSWLESLAVPASVLAAEEFLAATSLMDAVQYVRETFKPDGPELSATDDEVRRASPIFAIWLTAIRRAILPNGEISDDASPQLRRIRAGIGQARDTIRQSLESILRARGRTAGEDYVTLRNDRFVIPVRASRPPRGSGRGARRQRHGPDGVRRAARSHRTE